MNGVAIVPQCLLGEPCRIFRTALPEDDDFVGMGGLWEKAAILD